MSQTRREEVPPVEANFGDGFLQQIFGGKSFIHCVVELLKNSRDWGAGAISITTSDRTRFVIFDDGRGMNRANRNAFVSINMTTAGGPRQAGRYDTGTKKMLFSQATHVRVLTAPEEEPDSVYAFDVATDEYERLVLSKGTITPRRMRKNATSWPYQSRFGTEITYTLREPSRTGVLRGERLGAELAARLPRKFRGIVSVDGADFPEKQIFGRVFEATEQHPALGEVALELYRPRHRRQEEDLLLTAVEVGDAPLGYLYRLLPDRLREEFPVVFLLPAVCGTIAAAFLWRYVNEDRRTLDPKIADDPHTVQLVRFLARFAPAVQRALEIKMSEGGGAEDGDAEVRELASVCNRRYAKGKGPGDSELEDGAENAPPEGPDPVCPDPAISTHCRGEVEVGERFEVTARLRKNLEGEHGNTLRWYTGRSNAKLENEQHGKVTLVAQRIGHASVQVDLPGTPYSARAYYEVVAERVFRLSATHAQIRVGAEMILTAVNWDKLPGDGELHWEVAGSACAIGVEGKRITVRGVRNGIAKIIARSKSDSRASAECEITVVGREQEQLCIRGHWFAYRTVDVEGKEHEQPAAMMRGSKVHALIFNRSAPGYEEALKRGTLLQFLMLATAQEFARFAYFDLGDYTATGDPRESRDLHARLLATGYQVFAELMEGSASNAATATT